MTDLLKAYKDELGSGLWPSHPGRRAFFWQDGRNITFEHGYVQSSFGQFQLFTTEEAAPVCGIRASNVADLRIVFYGTPSKLYRWDIISGIEDLSGAAYTGSLVSPWQFSRWGTWMLATNGVEKIQVYKNTGNFGNLANQPFDWAKLIYTTDTHLIALNTSNGPNFIEWTDLDNIEVWAAASTNDAGNKPLRNLDSPIIAAKKLGDNLIGYTANEMFAVAYLGSPFVFGVQFLLEGFGPFGPNSIASTGNKHYGMGQRGIWVTDGTSFEFIHSPAVHDFVYRDEATRVDLELSQHVVAWHDQLQAQIVFYYPKVNGNGYNDIGLGFNYKTNLWTIYDYGRTAVDDSGVFAYALTGDQSGNIFQQSVSDAPPTSGDLGIVNLDETLYTLELGLGEGALGELGLGGYADGAG